jgi:hypothetical protein
MLTRQSLLVCLLSALPINLHAQTILYNSTLSNLPADQGWFTYITNSPSNASQTVVPLQGTQLVTSGSASAGYFNTNLFTGTLVNPQFPILDRNIGFRLSVNLLINSETHSNNNRAGFSIIALCSDHSGIELGFWNNEIWAQTDTPIFTHGEGVSFTTTTLTNYQLEVLGNGYTLLANGNSILTGPLRDYTMGFNSPPYTYDNFLFLGDDTSSANADITLGQVSLLAAIPEPATWISLGCVGIGLGYWYWRRSRHGDIDLASTLEGE